MKVYVLESGCYDERAIVGVFATPELAMAAWQPRRAPDSNSSYTWGERETLEGLGDMGWTFHAATDEDHARVHEFEVALA